MSLTWLSGKVADLIVHVSEPRFVFKRMREIVAEAVHTTPAHRVKLTISPNQTPTMWTPVLGMSAPICHSWLQTIAGLSFEDGARVWRWPKANGITQRASSRSK